MSEMDMENKILATNPTPARITPDHIDRVIIATDFHTFTGTCLTICQITLRNGFTVTGESACADPANYNVCIGREIAEKNARAKIWALEGYLLRERLSAGTFASDPLTQLAMDHAAWSQDTFGPDDERGPIGPIKHLIKEASEMLDAPGDLTEYADGLLLLLDASRRAGLSANQLVNAGRDKLRENMARVWPDALPEDEPIEHVKPTTPTNGVIGANTGRRAMLEAITANFPCDLTSFETVGELKSEIDEIEPRHDEDAAWLEALHAEIELRAIKAKEAKTDDSQEAAA